LTIINPLERAEWLGRNGAVYCHPAATLPTQHPSRLLPTPCRTV